MATRPPRKSQLKIRVLSTAIAACFATGAAWSLPVAPTVVNGTTSFNQAGNVLSITNSANAIINWQKFGISVGELTRFIQPSVSSSVLNRIVDGNITLTDGAAIEAGYDVYLGLLGQTSTLYLDKTADLAPSYIVADHYSGVPLTINLAFPSLASGGIVIDGAETITSTPGGSGVFVLDRYTPATPSFGLNIYYGLTRLDAGVSNTRVNTLLGSTSLNTYTRSNLSMLGSTGGTTRSNSGEAPVATRASSARGKERARAKVENPFVSARGKS